MTIKAPNEIVHPKTQLFAQKHISITTIYIGAVHFQKAPLEANKGMVKNKQFAFNVLKYGWFIGWVVFIIGIAFVRPSKYCGGFFWALREFYEAGDFYIFDQVFVYLPDVFVKVVGKTANGFGFCAVLLVFLWWTSKLEETKVMETRILMEKIEGKKVV